MSLAMSFFISLILTWMNVGFVPGFFNAWLKSFIVGFIVALPIALVIFPPIKRISDRLTE
ncbi:MAG: DUF2798 domain-containing protein [Candidatus Woesearchaeota archaeon]|nr:DUF2798 domain-containing protein [Candidatus Woesearchaeota archaeon]